MRAGFELHGTYEEILHRLVGAAIFPQGEFSEVALESGLLQGVKETFARSEGGHGLVNG